MGSCAAPSAKGDDKFITTDYLQQCRIPPRDPSVKRLKFTGNVPDTTIWQHGDDLLVRSRAMLRDEFEQTLSSADGTHLWKLPVTPLLTFSVNGQSVHVTPELE